MNDEGRLTIEELADRFRTAAEAIEDLREASEADRELARREFLELMDREAVGRHAAMDQTQGELRDVLAEMRRLFGPAPDEGPDE